MKEDIKLIDDNSDIIQIENPETNLTIKKTEQEMQPIDAEIQVVQMENFITKFQNSMKNMINDSIKKAILLGGPLVLSVIGSIITKNPSYVFIGAQITGITGVTVLTLNLIKELKEMNGKKKKEIHTGDFYTTENPEKEVDKVLTEGIQKNTGSDFYTPEYKAKLIEGIHTTTEEINGDNLNKNQVLNHIIKELDIYQKVYKLPPIEISDKEWNIFFDKLYTLILIKKRQEEEYYSICTQILRLVCAKVLVEKTSKITIYDFIKNLSYLENSPLTTEEINNLQKEMLLEISVTQITNFIEDSNKRRN